MLVLRPGALGDTLLAVPALRALRRRFPTERLTLAAHGPAARLLASVGEVDDGITFDDPRLGWLFTTHSTPPTAEGVVAWLDLASVPGLRDSLVVAPSRPPAMDVHCASHLLNSLAWDASFDDRPLHVNKLESDEILIHPGSGSATKNWAAENFAAVIRLLGEQSLRLIVGEADASAAAAVESRLGRRLERVEDRPLEELAARLAGCRAYLGNDSGVSHLAGLCGARSVVLFGPSSPVVWRPLGSRVSVVGFESEPDWVVAQLLDG